MRCFCGCPDRVVDLHHCVTQQEIKRVHLTTLREGHASRPLKVLLTDERNLVPVAFVCHGSHHARSQPYRLEMLPDGVFEFAAELMGPERAAGWLQRRYVGEDARLDALLGAVAA